MIGATLFTATVALALVNIAYDTFARARGWTVGSVLSNAGSPTVVFSGFAFLWSLGSAAYNLSWWAPVPVLVAGSFIAFVLTMTLRALVQLLSILAIFPVGIAAILYASERRPLGFLHHFI